MRSINSLTTAIFLCGGSVLAETDQDIRFDFSAGYRHFNNDFHGDTRFDSDHPSYRSSPYASADIEYNMDSGELTLDSQIFVNWDKNDQGRRYFDVRNALVSYTSEAWKFGAGRGIVFWGVSETVNIINTINQIDLSKSIDGKEKIGQNMLSLGYLGDENTIDFFYFVGFEKLNYPDRPSPSIPLHDDEAKFEENDSIPNYAVRWQTSSDLGDISAGYFKGIRRDPLLEWSDKHLGLIPFYINTEYLTLEAVTFWGDSLLKMETKLGRELKKSFHARNIGIEYPIYPKAQWIQDITLIAENTYDSRGDTAESVGQDDVFIGVRLSLGDIAQYDSRIVLGYDLDYASKYLDFSFVYKATDFIRWEAKAIQFVDVNNKDSRLYIVENEDFVQLQIHLSF